MSLLFIRSVLTVVYLSPLYHGYSLGCPNNCLFVSFMSLAFIWGVLIFVYLSQLCHGYSLGVSSQWSFLSPLCHGYSLGMS